MSQFGSIKPDSPSVTSSYISMAPTPTSIAPAPSPPGSAAGFTTEPTSPTSSCPPAEQRRDQELARKRARDRKSQQAMRDRTKWTIHTLSEQVAVLSTALDQRTRQLATAEEKVDRLETENTQVRAQNAALQLSLMGRKGEGANQEGDSPAATSRAGSSSHGFGGLPVPVWELRPKNTSPTCQADHIMQTYLDNLRAGGAITPSSSASGERRGSSMSDQGSFRPNLGSLVGQKSRPDDDGVSSVVGDVLKTYREIEGLPEQTALFSVLAMYLKWMVLPDQQSWGLLPSWLRPTHAQINTPHAAWIDRVPWPKAREYLIRHPEVTFDNFAAVYNSNLRVNWSYDPSSVLLGAATGAKGFADVTINPVFEEHIRQLRHWTVSDTFRGRFPELSRIIDSDTGNPSEWQLQQMSPISSMSVLHRSPSN